MEHEPVIHVSMTFHEWDNLLKLISQAIHPERTGLIPPEIDRLREYQRKIQDQIGNS